MKQYAILLKVNWSGKSMKVYKNFNINKSHRNSIILIGNFDGVHLGHRKLFNLAKKFSDKFKIKIGVLTFDPMPKIFFNKKIKNFKISNFKQKKNLLQQLGVQFIINKKFDLSFSKTKSIDFIEKIIFKKLKISKFQILNRKKSYYKNLEFSLL